MRSKSTHPTSFTSKSAFICSLAVVIVPLLDFVFRGKKLNEKSLIGCVLAVVGVALLEVGDVGEMSFGSGDLATFFQPLGESNEREASASAASVLVV
ncbi:hypothetical protein TL16_g09003 [Triparma laevis f. inornata]|uniref:EamA domain-containing protein n=1 Tax=Triparma laevis f. inornata TaxID=1714386 RepID=A0A9W7B798_9STRA|nr:hypothetical protein TL16_g09003 [Triparma laevis f. inornata]